MGFCFSSPLSAWREKSEYWYKPSNLEALLANTGSGQGRMERNKTWSENYCGPLKEFFSQKHPHQSNVGCSGLSLEHLSHLYLVRKLQNQRASHIASEMPSLKHCPQKWSYQSHSFSGWVTWLCKFMENNTIQYYLPTYITPGEVVIVHRAQTNQLWAVIWWKLHAGKACLVTPTKSKYPLGPGAASFPPFKYL